MSVVRLVAFVVAISIFGSVVRAAPCDEGEPLVCGVPNSICTNTGTSPFYACSCPLAWTGDGTAYCDSGNTDVDMTGPMSTVSNASGTVNTFTSPPWSVTNPTGYAPYDGGNRFIRIRTQSSTEFLTDYVFWQLSMDMTPDSDISSRTIRSTTIRPFSLTQQVMNIASNDFNSRVPKFYVTTSDPDVTLVIFSWLANGIYDTARRITSAGVPTAFIPIQGPTTFTFVSQDVSSTTDAWSISDSGLRLSHLTNFTLPTIAVTKLTVSSVPTFLARGASYNLSGTDVEFSAVMSQVHAFEGVVYFIMGPVSTPNDGVGNSFALVHIDPSTKILTADMTAASFGVGFMNGINAFAQGPTIATGIFRSAGTGHRFWVQTQNSQLGSSGASSGSGAPGTVPITVVDIERNAMHTVYSTVGYSPDVFRVTEFLYWGNRLFIMVTSTVAPEYRSTIVDVSDQVIHDEFTPPLVNHCTLTPIGACPGTLTCQNTIHGPVCGCPAGKIVSGTSCVNLPDNSYQSEPGNSTTATSCPLGTGNTGGNPTAQSSALSCNTLAGHTGLGFGHLATPCPAGTFKASGGFGTCTACLAGTFSTGGASQCTGCPSGTFGTSTGGTSELAACSNCTTGKFFGTTGGTQCVDCTAGKFASSQRQSECTSCSAGTASTSLAATTSGVCTECAAGTASSVLAATECVACTAGKFTATTHETECTSCSTGTASSVTSATQCANCVAGSFASTTQQTQCTSCAAGTWESNTASSQCTTCHDGSTTSGTGSTTDGDCDCVAGRQTVVTPPPCDKVLQAFSPTLSTGVGNPYPNFLGTGKDWAYTINGATTSDGEVTGPTGAGIMEYNIYDPTGTTRLVDLINSGLTLVQVNYTGGADALSTIVFYVDIYSFTPTIPKPGTLQFDISGHPFLTGVGFFGFTKTGNTNSITLKPTYKLVAPVCNTPPDISCSPCPTGSFSSSTAATQCTSCEAGKFTSTISSTVCSTCSEGSYATNVGNTVCTTCPQDQTTPSTGSTLASDCKCNAGFAGPGSVAGCTSCDNGTYSDSFGLSACKTCNAGTFNSVTSATACQNCASGKFQSSSSASACDGCPSGTFGTTSAATSSSLTNCPLCTQGKYSSSTAGVTECTSCPSPSTTTSSTGSTSTSDCDCSPGYFGPDNAVSTQVCSQCVAGKYATGIGSTTCVECSAGKASSATGASVATACTDCLLHTYASATGAGTCTNCPTNAITYGPGSTLQTHCVCDTGYTGANGGTCTGCDLGKYKDTTGADACKSCAIGKYSTTPASKTSFDCTPCSNPPSPSITTVAEGSNSPNLCVCNAGYGGTGGPTPACNGCAAGTFKVAIADGTCIGCPASTYSTALAATNLSVCQTCPNNTITAGGSTGQDHIDDCVCDTGSFLAPSGRGAECTLCSRGKFQAAPGQSECTPCAEDTFGTVVGGKHSGVCTACPFGGTNGTTGNDDAADCSCGAGTFSSSPGVCALCPSGTYQPSANQTFCHLCPENHHGNDTGSISRSGCEACPGGSSSPPGSPNATSCECNLGKTGPDGGQCTSCVAGKFKDAMGSAACTDCAAGTYNSHTGRTVCMTCHANSGSHPGADDPTDCKCNAGYTGAGSCGACLAGTYKPDSNDDGACTPCSAGTYSEHTASTNSSTCFSCPSNSNSNPGSDHSTDCICNVGYTGANGGTCTACPLGKFKSAPGAGVCTECHANTYGGGAGASACASCTTNAITNGTGHTNIESCECKIHYGGAPGGTCTLCPAGKFKSSVGSTTCTECGVGKYGSVTGSTISMVPECFDCTAGSYTSTTGQTVCTPLVNECPTGVCPPGTTCTDTMTGYNCTCNSPFVGPVGVNGDAYCHSPDTGNVAVVGPNTIIRGVDYSTNISIGSGNAEFTVVYNVPGSNSTIDEGVFIIGGACPAEAPAFPTQNVAFRSQNRASGRVITVHHVDPADGTIGNSIGAITVGDFELRSVAPTQTPDVVVLFGHVTGLTGAARVINLYRAVSIATLPSTAVPFLTVPTEAHATTIEPDGANSAYAWASTITCKLYRLTLPTSVTLGTLQGHEHWTGNECGYPSNSSLGVLDAPVGVGVTIPNNFKLPPTFSVLESKLYFIGTFQKPAPSSEVVTGIYTLSPSIRIITLIMPFGILSPFTTSSITGVYREFSTGETVVQLVSNTTGSRSGNIWIVNDVTHSVRSIGYDFEGSTDLAHPLRVADVCNITVTTVVRAGETTGSTTLQGTTRHIGRATTLGSHIRSGGSGNTPLTDLCLIATRPICVTGSSCVTQNGVPRCICDQGFGYTGPALNPPPEGACSPCVSGTYKDVAGNLACSSCVAGHYGLTTGATSVGDGCGPCHAPFTTTLYPASAAIDACVCTPGATGGGGATACNHCVPGTHKTTAGDHACDLCPVNTWGNATGSQTPNNCMACPSATESPAGSNEITDCVCTPATHIGPPGGPCLIITNVRDIILSRLSTNITVEQLNEVNEQFKIVGIGVITTAIAMAAAVSIVTSIIAGSMV